jgi:hypothetical protein
MNRRHVHQIERHKTEAAALQQKIGGAQRVIDIFAAHPEQLFQVHAGGFGGVRIEAVRRVDQRARFTLGGACGERRDEQTGAARAGRAENFGERAAGQTAG